MKKGLSIYVKPNQIITPGLGNGSCLTTEMAFGEYRDTK